jgi:hypothetical protein
LPLFDRPISGSARSSFAPNGFPWICPERCGIWGDRDLELLLRAAFSRVQASWETGAGSGGKHACRRAAHQTEGAGHSSGTNRIASGLTRGQANAVRAAFAAGSRQHELPDSSDYRNLRFARLCLPTSASRRNSTFREEEARPTARLSMQSRPLIFFNHVRTRHPKQCADTLCHC